MSGTFVCGHCGGTFEDLSADDDEVRAEAVAAFPGIDLTSAVTVCDACYAAYMAGPRRSSE